MRKWAITIKSDIWEVLGTMGAYVREVYHIKLLISKDCLRKWDLSQPIASQEKKEWSYYADGKKCFNIRYSIRDALGQEINTFTDT